MSGASGAKAAHRLLTVMFCDMVDSTGHQFRLEPERFATILRNYRQIIFERVERHGGYTARVVGELVFHLAPKIDDDPPNQDPKSEPPDAS